MNTTPLVTAIYARLSSASEESVSIARQVAECQTEADRRGWKVAVVATDDGVSATKNRPDERPGWRQVAARFDDLDAVLFWKSDRLTRRVSHFYEVIGQAEKHGVALVSVTERDLDLSTATGRAFAGLLQIFAEFEAEQISARIRSARVHHLRQGRVVGGQRPWPFEAVPRPDGPGVVWRPVPERAEAVRWAVDGLISGELSPYAIAREWDRRGLPPKKGGSQWNHASVRLLLRNPALYGARIVGNDVLRDEDGAQRIDPGQAIIDRATWRQLQDAMKRRSVSRGSTPSAERALLYGVLVCDACDAPMYARRLASGNPPPSYVCGNRACPAGQVSINLRMLDEYITRHYLESWSWVPETREVVERVSANEAEVAELRDDLEDVQTALDVTDDDAAALKLIRRRRELRERLAAVQDAAETVIRHEPTGRTVAEAWAAATDEDEKRRLLAASYGQIRIKKGVRGRRGLDEGRVVILGPEDGG